MNPAESATKPLKILGRYALHEVIASGGMATVHYGRLLGPVGFARTVAIKRLHERLAQDPEFTSMFLDEARLAARIRHPNVVPTLDVVAMENELFLVMEYVQGESLSRLYHRERERGSRIDVKMLTTIIAGALHGLHAAHEATNERGEPLMLVHRDISPQNILVGVDGVARVLDFGVAKAAGRAATTRDGQLKGKLSYMAPEQLRGSEVTRAVDIYAAGVVLWEGLVGRKLYKADTEGALVGQVLAAKVDAPSKHVPGIPPELDELVLKSLAKKPEKRFATAREMARALEKLMQPVPTSEIGEWVEAMAGRDLAVRTQTLSLIERSSTSDITAIAGSEFSTQSSLTPPSQPGVVVPPASSSSSAAAAAMGNSRSPGFIGPPSVPHLAASGGGTAVTQTALPETSLTNASAIEIPVHGPKGKKVYFAFAAIVILLLGIGITLASLSRGGASDKPIKEAATSPPTPTSTIPPPDPTATATAIASTAKVEEAPSASAQPMPSVVSKTTIKPGPRPTSAPTPAPTPTTTPKATTTAPAPNCDPPYIIEPNGTRKYKRECAK